ncbi:MAG TPA: hypothetical protein VGC79_36205 [Polyangiaceae bacterium]
MSKPRSRLLTTLAALTAFAAQSGCSGEKAGAGPSADSDRISLPDLSGRLVHAVCDNIGACCASAAIHFDLATCQLNAPGSIDFFLKDGQSPSVEYDSAAGARCLAAYQSLLETCSPITAEAQQACAGLFSGTLRVGQPCSSAGECAKPSPGEGVYCAGRDSGPTVCTVFPTAHAQLGDHCAGTCDSEEGCIGSAPSNTICFREDGLECDPLAFKCRRPAAIGTECGGSDGQCAIDAFCNENSICEAPRTSGACQSSQVKCSVASYCKAGQCSPKELAGTPCRYSEECAGGYCSVFDGTATCGVYVSKLATADTCIGHVF